MTDQKRGPGRPRVQAVVNRDETVHRHLVENGARQVRDIVDATDLGRNAVYLSLWRLRRDERVTYRREGAQRLWEAVTQ